ncbi:Carboxylesterase NlhH [Brevundimonas sp. SH203]|uniref:alpha/beta hydrolase n=1 Tax=Brevundimonas sp. SH203 TaxID=345167 RepID=UPI0009C52D48|nr:alpha/beta hydrolase [Brevundimonas sp. SH203]GAW41118.1 Carboxylesterase NlhH [Brevundimonas sp. SH203]
MNRRSFAFGLAGAGVAATALAGWGEAAFAAGQPATAADPILSRVDPELREGAIKILERPLPAWTEESLAALRAFPPMNPQPSSSPATVERRTAPGRRGQPDVGFELIGAKPSATLRPAIVHIHGGGFILGRVSDTTVMCQDLATEFDCVVANVDYRLSPETRFPGPMEDCYAVLAWVHANAEALGVDPARVAVMGESAGGGLAAMVAIASRDRGDAPLCYQVLIYPMLDDRTGSTMRVPPFIGTIGWNEAGNRFGWSCLLGLEAGSAVVPYGAVPARLDTVAGLAPAFIGVGGLDLFVNEDIDYARRLVQAGVPVQLHVTPGAYHGFDFIAPQARVSRDFAAAWKSGLRAALHPPSASG